MGNSNQGLFEAGQHVAGRYQVVRLLGMGAVGSVYEAEHIELRRRVALKVLRRMFFKDERMLARFLQEARTAASVNHPGVVQVFDLGQDDEGVVFIAMEMLEGEELNARIRREHPLPVEFVVRVGCDLADAVAAAHARGIVHRDLKPQNVFLANAGRHRDIVKVLDFGLAKINEPTQAALTQTGEVFGSPYYMAPEQLRNSKDVDQRTDVYSLGVILYEALAGTPPFKAEKLYDLVLKIATEQPRPLQDVRPDTPDKLIEVIQLAMTKGRDGRFATVREMLDELERVLHALSN